MVVSFPISDEALAILTARATEAGVDTPTYIATLFEQSAHTPISIHDLSGPTASDFATSNLTDDQLGDLLEERKHEMRREKRMTIAVAEASVGGTR